MAQGKRNRNNRFGMLVYGSVQRSTSVRGRVVHVNVTNVWQECLCDFGTDDYCKVHGRRSLVDISYSPQEMPKIGALIPCGACRF